MNAKILTAVVGILLLVPAGVATGYRFGDCSYKSGYTSITCEADPNDSGEPPALVTGHTVYAKFIIDALDININNVNNKVSLGLPTDFAAIAGYFRIRDEVHNHEHRDEQIAAQRECVVWFNGKHLDQQPANDEFAADADGPANATNDFPSDEDENAHPHGQGQPYDDAMQDYDFDRDVTGCDVERYGVWEWTWDWNNTTYYHSFAVAVEKGDCNPESGSNFRYRGHLDFIDPNSVYHEVQEYDYSCALDLPKERVGCVSEDDLIRTDDPADGGHGLPKPPVVGGDAENLTVRNQGCVREQGNGGSSAAISNVVNQLFPWTYTDAHNEIGCSLGFPPTLPSVSPGGPGAFDVVNNTTVSTGNLDLGHKCNGTIQDLFKERLWMTQVHAPEYDNTIGEYYTFALQVDTCAGLNPYDITGKQVDKNLNNSSRYYELPASVAGVPVDQNAKTAAEIYHEILLENAYAVTDPVRDLFGQGVGNLGLEFVDLCTDGSSFSFDDTFRGRTVHAGAPLTAEDIMRGNSFDNDGNSPTWQNHREVCRADDLNHPNNFYPNGSPNATVYAPFGVRVGPVPLEPDVPTSDVDCYQEDHKTAFVDLYVFDTDPTGGLWAVNSKGIGIPGTPVVYGNPTEYPPGSY